MKIGPGLAKDNNTILKPDKTDTKSHIAGVGPGKGSESIVKIFRFHPVQSFLI